VIWRSSLLVVIELFSTGATTLNRKSSSPQKLIIGALGAAVVLPIFFVPVSATTSDGTFLIHAQDYNNPKPHEAYAGLKGLKKNADGSWSSAGGNGGSTGGGSGTGSGGDTGAGGSGDGTETGSGGSTGGGSTGGGTGASSNDGTYGSSGPGSSSDTSKVIGTYTAGPVSLRVTQDMLDFSAANLKAQEEGRIGDIKTTPNGWKTVWFSDGADNYSQTPSSITADTTVYLTKALSAPTNWWDPTPGDMNNIDTVVYYDKRGSSVEAGTKIGPSSVGTTFYYKKAGGSGGSSLKEGRYISESGSTIAAWVETMSSGYNVKRTISASNMMAPRSDTKPYMVDFQNGTPTMANIFLKTEVDGYDVITTQNGYARYGKANGSLAGDGSMDFSTPPRKNGPIELSGTTNSFSQLTYADADGNYTPIDEGKTSYTVADYNRITGQNWDGKFSVPSDFDTSKPFEPKA